MANPSNQVSLASIERAAVDFRNTHAAQHGVMLPLEILPQRTFAERRPSLTDLAGMIGKNIIVDRIGSERPKRGLDLYDIDRKVEDTPRPFGDLFDRPTPRPDGNLRDRGDYIIKNLPEDPFTKIITTETPQSNIVDTPERITPDPIRSRLPRVNEPLDKGIPEREIPFDPDLFQNIALKGLGSVISARADVDNDARANAHYMEHRQVYVAMALAEAAARGIEINWDGGTDDAVSVVPQ